MVTDEQIIAVLEAAYDESNDPLENYYRPDFEGMVKALRSNFVVSEKV